MKRLAIALLIGFLATTGAWAQLGLGISGAVYSDTEMSMEDFLETMQNGEGVFYGPFIELGMDKLALGLAMNFSMYEEDWSFFQDGSFMMEMMDYDVNLYLQSHPLGYDYFLDPFLEAGFGVMGKDYANEDDDPDLDNPIMSSSFFQFGGGVGINLGSLGIFVKGLYMFDLGANTGTYTAYDQWGNATPQEYDLAAYPLRKLKLLMGAKLLL